MMPNEISIEKFLQKNLPGMVNYSNDIVLVSDIAAVHLLSHPTRLHATTALICLSGEIECSINLKRYVVRENSLLVNFPGDIIQIHRVDGVKGSAAIISVNYTHELQLDARTRSDSIMNLHDIGPVSVPLAELEYIGHYDMLLRKSIADGNGMVVRALSLALAYSIIDLLNKYSVRNAEYGREQSRPQQIFDKFMRLLNEHHVKERSLQFYADRMFLSPKYVSCMIKSYSGRSAGEWINDYVVLEAKIMLRYSDLSVQQIAYHLNFPTQSAFGKYFKEQVGCSPRNYRKGL
mgnify:FL=1